jgi:hypothetical protein
MSIREMHTVRIGLNYRFDGYSYGYGAYSKADASVCSLMAQNISRDCFRSEAVALASKGNQSRLRNQLADIE